MGAPDHGHHLTSPASPSEAGMLDVRDAVTVRDHRADQELWRAHIGRAPVKMGEGGGPFEVLRQKETTARTGRCRAPVPGRAPVKRGEGGGPFEAPAIK